MWFGLSQWTRHGIATRLSVPSAWRRRRYAISIANSLNSSANFLCFLSFIVVRVIHALWGVFVRACEAKAVYAVPYVRLGRCGPHQCDSVEAACRHAHRFSCSDSRNSPLPSARSRRAEGSEAGEGSGGSESAGSAVSSSVGDAQEAVTSAVVARAALCGCRVVSCRHVSGSVEV